MAVRRRLIILLCLLTILVMANPVGAATSTRTNDTEDFVDATSNLHLATPDIGTHSVFADLQDYGANYDQMQEADTGSAGNDFEHFVNATSNLHDPAGKGTHSVFEDLQAKDTTYDTLTEANQGGGGGSEWLDCNAHDTTQDIVMTLVGDTPYLNAQDQPTHYVWSLSNTAQTGWYDFPTTSLSGTLTVNISIYCNNDDGAGNDRLDVMVDYTGSGAGSDVGDAGDHTNWQYDVISLGTHTVAEVNALRVWFDYVFSGGKDEVRIDHVRIGVSAAGSDDYELDLEVRFTDVDYDETGGEELCVYGGTQAAEALKVDVWDGSWVNIIADVATDGWSNVSIVSYLTSSSIEFRFIDADQASDGSGDTWNVDAMLIHAWTDASTNYELDLEIGWTVDTDFDETEEWLSIYPVTGSGWPAEEIHVEIWDGAWTPLFTDLTPDQWNNVTISSYLTSVDVEIRFLGGAESGDTTQDTWEIDAVLIHTYSYAYTESREEAVTIDETVTKAAEFARDFSESIDIDDSIATTVTIMLALFEALAVAVSLTTTASLKRVFSESIVINETLTNSFSIFRTFFESVTFDDAVSTQLLIQKFLYESIILSPTFSEVGTFARTLYESILFSPTFSEVGTFARTFFESVTFDETVSVQQMIQKFLFEAIVVTATISTTMSFSRRLGESIVLSPTFSEVGTFVREYFEGITFADHVEATKITGGNDYVKNLFESIVLSDSKSLVCSFVRVLSESIVISDTISTTFVGLWIKNLFESILFGENDIWADYRAVTTTTTYNPSPDKRRYIIPPIFPPNLVVAGIGGGLIFWIYFYGVPYVKESEATAYTRREKLKWEIRRQLKPILGPLERTLSSVRRKTQRKTTKKSGSILWRIKSSIKYAKMRLWKAIWKADR